MRRELEAVLQSVHTIPPSDLPEFLGDLDAIRNTAFVRMLTPEPEAREDRLLTAEQAAERLGCSKQYLYVNSRKFKFTRRVGSLLRFSSNGLDAYLKQKKEK